MKLVSVDRLKGDEVLARPIMTKNYSELLAAGTVLKPEYIEKLKELDIKEVYIKYSEHHYKKVEILKPETQQDIKTKKAYDTLKVNELVIKLINYLLCIIYFYVYFI
mgnify:CR=1 FL=1